MSEQIWFGSEQHFQWAPAPSTGMNVNNVGVGDSLTYQNGRVGVNRSMQTHKVYDMEFPVQEAAGLQGLDVYQKFASGFYGDCDSYPMFFADPMIFDQNLFPPGWATPGLYRRGWAPIVESGPKTYYNLVTNPSVEIDATGYAVIPGTGGVATGFDTSFGQSIAGTFSYRVQWSTATTAVSGGAKYSSVTVAVGESYDTMVYVSANKVQRVLVTVRFRDAALTSVGTVVGTQTVLPSVSATKLLVSGAVAPATATTMDIEVTAVAGTSGTNWAVNDWLQLDALMVNVSSAVSPTYFDGDTPGAAWTLTPHASTSIKYVGRQTATVTATSANVYNLPPVQAQWTVGTTPNAYPTPTNTYGDIPYALIPIPPGYTLWVGVTGLASGAAVVRVDAFNSPGNPASPASSTNLTLLSPTGATRLNASFSGSSYQYVKVYVTRTSNTLSIVTLSSMMAQLWPTGVTPTLTGNFIEGKGHRGLKFADSPTVESYVMVDRNRNVPAHYKGASMQLIESQGKG